MKCSHCDSELVPGAKFCDSCGAPVGASAADAPSAAPLASQESVYQPDEPFVQAPPYTPPVQTAKPPAYAPPVSFASSQPAANGAFQASEKIMGFPAAQMGTITLVLGGVGLLLSFVGCGGLLCVLGLVAGFLSLKTSGRSNAIIGMVLSGLGLIISLVMACIFIFSFIASGSYTGY